MNLITNLGSTINIVGVSTSKFLQRNENVIPSTFTQHNTSDNILINSDGANSYLQFKNISGPNNSLIGAVGKKLEFRTTNDDIIFRAQGGLVKKFRITQAGSANFTDNPSVSGVLQSPLTSLLSASSTALETNKMDKNLIGTSISNLNSKDITLGSSVSALETNKMDKNLVGVSISNLNNTINSLGIVSIGTSLSALKTNKMDRNLIGSSCANYQSKNDLMISYNTLNGNGIWGVQFV